jgi:ribosome modulation factor
MVTGAASLRPNEQREWVDLLVRAFGEIEMCQAFAGEQAFLIARDRNTRKRGYEAQKAGTPREECPEREHRYEQYSLAHQWRMGWDTAARGDDLW